MSAEVVIGSKDEMQGLKDERRCCSVKRGEEKLT